jgi:nickel-dependent lactate racemase
MKINLHYGKGLVYLQIPEPNIQQIIRPWRGKPTADNLALIKQALDDREVKNFQGDIAGKRLCVLTEDGTREAALDDTLLAPVFNLMRHVSGLRFLISTGTHDPNTPRNTEIKKLIRTAARKARLKNLEIHAHDCRQEEFINAGWTSRGTQVLFNSALDDADAFLVLSDIKTHYFAGYSNPVKNFVPGLCAFETTEHNHSLALHDNSTFGLHPWHNNATRRDNPLARDQLEAMQMIVKNRPVYTFATISNSKEIQWARFGPARIVAAAAFDRIDQRNTHTVRTVPYLVVSPGGLPNDITLYIAQRALELTGNAVTDGGEVLFLAACPDGIGEDRTMENFYNRLTAPLEQIFKSIESEYKLYNHKPYKFARMIRRLSKIWIYTQVHDRLVKAAHLHPTHQPQAVVNSWLARDPKARIIIVDGANKIALYAKAQPPQPA